MLKQRIHHLLYRYILLKITKCIAVLTYCSKLRLGEFQEPFLWLLSRTVLISSYVTACSLVLIICVALILPTLIFNTMLRLSPFETVWMHRNNYGA